MQRYLGIPDAKHRMVELTQIGDFQDHESNVFTLKLAVSVERGMI